MTSRFRSALSMPWRFTNEMRRWAAYPYIRAAFAFHGVAWGAGWHILGMPILQRHRQSTIQIGDRVSMRSWPRSNPLVPRQPVVLSTRSAEAVIRVGADCGFTGAVLVAAERITLGDRVQVGANVSIVDTDFHPLTPAGRARDFSAGAHAPIVIGDDVFIGMESLILKGVEIGAGSAVGAGSVVSRDVPAHTVVAGNPAKVIRELRKSPDPSVPGNAHQ